MNYKYNNIDLLIKTFIILSVILGIMYLFYRIAKSRNITENIFTSKKKSSIPKLHFYGRSLGETISVHAFCRVIDEKGYDWKDIITGYRPDFLKNEESGKNLEIDAYHPKAKVGIEYNGYQHYIYPNVFHKTLTEFNKCTSNDDLKLKLAKNKNIKIITIPYHIDTCIKKNNSDKYIKIKRTNKEREDIIYEYIKKKFD